MINFGEWEASARLMLVMTLGLIGCATEMSGAEAPDTGPGRAADAGSADVGDADVGGDAGTGNQEAMGRGPDCSSDDSCPYCRATCEAGTAGAGPRFVARSHADSDLRDIAFSADGATAYVLLSNVIVGDQKEGAVFAVDMASGDRAVVSGRAVENPDADFQDQTTREVGTGPTLEDTTAMVMGADGMLYVHRRAQLSQGGLLRVDPTSGNREQLVVYDEETTFADDCASLTPSDVGMALDPATGRFYFGGNRLSLGSGIIEVSLDPLRCRLVSTSPAGDELPEVGRGPSFGARQSPANIDYSDGLLFVTNFTNGGIWSIDPQDGARERLVSIEDEGSCFYVGSLAATPGRIYGTGGRGIADGGSCAGLADQVGWLDLSTGAYTVVDNATGPIGRTFGVAVVHPLLADTVVTANNQGLVVFSAETRDSHYLSH